MVSTLLTVRHFSTAAIFSPYFPLYLPQDPSPVVTFTEFALTDYSRAMTLVVRARIWEFLESSLDYWSEANLFFYFVRVAVPR